MILIKRRCSGQYLSTLQVFSGFKGAQTTSALQTKRPPIGPESCWGSAVSHGLPSADTSMLSAGSKVPKRDRLCRGSAVSHGLPSTNTSPLSRFLAGSKVPKRHRRCRPNGHPLGLNSAGALLFRMGCPAPIPPCFQRLRSCLNAIGAAGALLFRMGCPAPIPLHSPGF